MGYNLVSKEDLGLIYPLVKDLLLSMETVNMAYEDEGYYLLFTSSRLLKLSKGQESYVETVPYNAISKWAIYEGLDELNKPCVWVDCLVGSLKYGITLPIDLDGEHDLYYIDCLFHLGSLR